VEPDFQAFMADRADLRKAWHCASSLFHLHDWVYAARKPSIDANYQFVDDNGQTKPVSRVEHFANALGQKHPEFQLIRTATQATLILRSWRSPCWICGTSCSLKGW
jgi:hypothetical protein